MHFIPERRLTVAKYLNHPQAWAEFYELAYGKTMNNITTCRIIQYRIVQRTVSNACTCTILSRVYHGYFHSVCRDFTFLVLHAVRPLVSLCS